MAQSSHLQRGVDIDRFRVILNTATDDETLFPLIVNTPFTDKLQTTMMGLGIIVFLLVNKRSGTIDRVALSNNEQADGTKRMSVKRFEDIRIPITHTENIIAQAISSGRPQNTTDWQYLFTPELTAEEARLNQAGGAIAISYVYPLTARDGGALIFSYHTYPAEIQHAQLNFMQQYTDLIEERLSS